MLLYQEYFFVTHEHENFLMFLFLTTCLHNLLCFFLMWLKTIFVNIISNYLRIIVTYIFFSRWSYSSFTECCCCPTSRQSDIRTLASDRFFIFINISRQNSHTLGPAPNINTILTFSIFCTITDEIIDKSELTNTHCKRW